MKLRIGQHMWRMALMSALIVVVFAMAAGVALAEGPDDSANVTVTGGSLAVTGFLVPDFTSMLLDGTSQTQAVTPTNFAVVDARGAGSGWKVTVQAPFFDNATQTGKDLAPGCLELKTVPTVAATDAGSSGLPAITDRTANLYIDTAGTGTAIKIASAPADGTGMGSYSFTQAASGLVMHLPAKAYTGTYNTTLTISIADGPGS